MKPLSFILIFCFIGSTATAQESELPRIKYNSWLYLNDSKRPLQGVILETNDTTIRFIEAVFIRRNVVQTPYAVKTVPIASIEKIKVRSKKNVSKGFLLFGLSGALLGAGIGYIQGDDSCDPNLWFDCMFAATAGEKAVTGAVVGALAGSGAGVLIGSTRKTVSIDGNPVFYMDKREELKSYSLLSQ